MIIAVPEQASTHAGGMGVPDYVTTLTWYRWFCTMCKITAPSARASHAELALRQGDYHAEQAQCHTTGQLSLW